MGTNGLNFCPGFFGYVGKRIYEKDKTNFEVYDVTIWKTNYYNTHIAQHFRSRDSQTMQFGQLIELNVRNIFL